MRPGRQLIALGVKTVETRSWSTTHRGPLAIHASKGFGQAGVGEVRKLMAASPAIQAAVREFGFDHPVSDVNGLPRGVVLAVADLVDVMPADDAARRMG